MPSLKRQPPPLPAWVLLLAEKGPCARSRLSCMQHVCGTADETSVCRCRGPRRLPAVHGGPRGRQLALRPGARVGRHDIAAAGAAGRPAAVRPVVGELTISCPSFIHRHERARRSRLNAAPSHPALFRDHLLSKVRRQADWALRGPRHAGWRQQRCPCAAGRVAVQPAAVRRGAASRQPTDASSQFRRLAGRWQRHVCCTPGAVTMNVFLLLSLV